MFWTCHSDVILGLRGQGITCGSRTTTITNQFIKLVDSQKEVDRMAYALAIGSAFAMILKHHVESLQDENRNRSVTLTDA